MSTDTRTKTSVKRKAPESSQVLDRLVRMISRADAFVLGFVKCNHPLQQKEMRREFLARLGNERVLEVELDKPLVSLLDELTARWDPSSPPDVVCVYGLEKSINELQEASPVLGRLNNDRDLLRRAVPVPLLIWLPDFALDFIARGAPDFWAWRSGVYEFETEGALWQRDGIQVASTSALGIYSLNYREKNAEIAHLQELLRTAQDLPRKGKREKELIASLMYRLGLVYQSLGRNEEATAVYQQNLQTFTALGNKGGIATTLHQIAQITEDRGDLEGAERLYHQSLKISQDLGDKRGIASILHQLAMLAQGRGDLESARRLYSQSLGIGEDLGDKSGIAISLHQLAMLEQIWGNLEGAERLYRQSLLTKEEIGDRSGSASTLHQLAMLAQGRGDLEGAERLYSQSLSIGKDLGDKTGIALTNGQLGRLYQERGQLRAAIEHYMPAWLAFCEMHSPYSRVARQCIQEVREQVGEEQFQKWLAEEFGPKAVEIRKRLDGALPVTADVVRQEPAAIG